MKVAKIKTILLAFSGTLMAISLIILPKEALDASVRGLNMWWGVVFPSLFPFFLISELLIGFGVVKFVGVLIEPLMRPLFRVPGVGGFAWAMGMATGFPAGAKLSARLRQEKQLSQIEAERLVSFTNSSSPLFIFGAVSVGFFHQPRLGFLLATAHYLGNLLVGLIMRFYGKDKEIINHDKKSPFFNIPEAFSALHQTRIKNKKPIGKLLGDAVHSSFQTLFMIGGFMIFFSVLNKLLQYFQITDVLAAIINVFLVLFQLPSELGVPLIAGIFEITIGNQLTSEVHGANLMQQAILASFILGFSGLSVQAQVASILAETDIRFKPFFIARIFHGFLSALIAFLLWKPFVTYFNPIKDTIVPVDLPFYENWWESTIGYLIQIGPPLTLIAMIFYIILNIKKMRTS